MFRTPRRGLYGHGAIVNLLVQVNCNSCERNIAVRQCNECGAGGDAFMQCENCSIELHSRGQRKRHVYATIVYGEESL
jgi:hypothetical protein